MTMRRTGLKYLGIVERLQIGISLLLQLAILVVVFGALFRQQWLIFITGSVVLALTFVPSAIERQFKVQLPIEFTLAACGFLYAAFGLGEVGGFYARFWWWDMLLHSFSALAMGLIGFLMIYVFYMTHCVRIAPIYVATISFGFAVTFGTLWEVFEFGMDWFFGFNMQKSGLPDTMTDLALDVVGGLIAAMIGYAYVKSGDSLIADRIIRHFVAKNPNLFTRKKIPK
jgi:hypothetical protein